MTGKLVIFPTPADASVTFIHDNDMIFGGHPETVAGRPAQVVLIDQDVPNGHGGTLIIQRTGYAPESQHGVLWLDRLNPVTGSAGFDADTFALLPVPPPPNPGPGPDPLPAFGRLIVQDENFYATNGSLWKWKGSTDMYLPAKLAAGQDILPIIRQRKDAGANILRSLAMVDWDWLPWWSPKHTADYWTHVQRYFELLAAEEMWLELTVFAGTKRLMPNQGEQLEFWQQTIDLARQYPHILLELLNEDGHPTQSINPQVFAQPSGELLASHGSGLTDADMVRPLWDFGTYHSRRDSPPDTRGFTNYDAYEFQASYPKQCPTIPDEGMKPENYRHDPNVALLMGLHCDMHSGGTFHTTQGATDGSILWPANVEDCAKAFYAAITLRGFNAQTSQSSVRRRMRGQDHFSGEQDGAVPSVPPSET